MKEDDAGETTDGPSRWPILLTSGCNDDTMGFSDGTEWVGETGYLGYRGLWVGMLMCKGYGWIWIRCYKYECM